MSNEIDVVKLMTGVIQNGVIEGIRQKMTSTYNNPLGDMVDKMVNDQADSIRDLIRYAIQSCVAEESFRDEIRLAVRTNMAKTLVAKFGGELEKQVNALKSDPVTRAKITMAITEIVKERSAATA